MAFLIDRGIAAESEEEFDAEGDRYEELKNKLLNGQTMKYEETEELLAAAKTKNDQKVIDVLKNIVDDSATDTVTESEKEPTKTELLDKLIKMCEPGSGLQIALEEIKDKFALDESNTDGWDADTLVTSNVGTIILDFQASCEPGSELDAAAEKIKTALPPAVRQRMARMRIMRTGKIRLNRSYNFQKMSLLAFIKSIDKIFSDKHEYDAARNLAQDILDEFFDRGDNLTQEAVDALRKAGLEPGRQGITPDMLTFAPPAPGLDEINSVLREYGIVAEPFQGKTGFVLYLAAARAAGVSESAVDGPVNILLEEDDIEEKEELLPDSVVNEAVETLRRMF